MEGVSAVRGSRSSAMRKARPNALKTVSAWWCELVPRRLSIWSVTWAWLANPWKNSCRRSTSNSPTRARLNSTWYSSPGRPGEVDNHPGERLVQGDVRLPVPEDATLVAYRLRHGLAERDTHVLDRVVRIHVQITTRGDFQVDPPVASDLLEHVFEKRQSRVDLRATLAI